MKLLNKFNILKNFKHILLLALLLSLTAALSCSHMIRINSSPPGALVVVDGRKVGHTPTRFKEDPWPGDHEIQVSAPGYSSRVVRIERKQTNWWWVAAGFGGCALCSGPACLTGASLANLSLCPACAGCMLSSGASLGTILSILSAPGLCTIPAMGIGGLIGSSPLGLLALADESPDKIMIKMKALPGYEASPVTENPGSSASATKEHTASEEHNADAPPASPEAPPANEPGPVLSY